jgi:beta-galactosidase
VYADSAPDWEAKKYPPYDPDSLNSVASNGVKIVSQNAPDFCFHHLGIRNLTLNFYSQVAAVALESFSMFGYDLRSESHFVNWICITDLPDVQYCYCKNTQKRFRQWLKAKYGSLSELNEV